MLERRAAEATLKCSFQRASSTAKRRDLRVLDGVMHGDHPRTTLYETGLKGVVEAMTQQQYVRYGIELREGAVQTPTEADPRAHIVPGAVEIDFAEYSTRRIADSRRPEQERGPVQPEEVGRLLLQLHLPFDTRRWSELAGYVDNSK